MKASEVHVWRAALDVPLNRLRRLCDLLSEDERARAERFRFPLHRNRFAVARGLLREILGTYSGDPPQGLRFRYGTSGKPELDGEATSAPLKFNLSHSGGLALYAVARGRELGVDIETLRPGVEEEEIAERFFSAREVETLRSVPSGGRTEAFFNCWTRKEAYIKARGEGLSLPLDGFDVSLTPGEPAALLAVRGALGETERWSLRALDAGAGYAAALAVEGQRFRLRRWQWTEPPHAISQGSRRP